MFTSFAGVASWLRAHFGDDDRGASLVEYALLLAFIAMVCVVAVTFLGKQTNSQYSNVGSSLN